MEKKVKKAVILAAGEGKRLQPITDTRPKHLIKIAGKPLIAYMLDALNDAGVEKTAVIIGYLKEKFYREFPQKRYRRIDITFIEQKKFGGTADAVLYARDFVGNEPFILIYGDLLVDPEIITGCIEFYNNQCKYGTIGKDEIEKAASEFKKTPREGNTVPSATGDTTEANGVICLFSVKEPEKFGIVALDDNGFVTRIVEKPPDGRYGNLANAGIYILDPNVFTAAEVTPLSPRKEYELTDTLSILISAGYGLYGYNIGDKFWSDVGHPWQLLDASKFILDKMKGGIFGTIENGVTVKGKVFVGENTLIKAGTYIEGPVYIGKDCVIGPNAYIRPYAVIEDGCRVGNSSEIKNSIIMEHTYLSHLSYCGDSIIGSGVNFGAGTVIGNVRLDKGPIKMNIKGKRVSTGRKKMGAVIGDNVSLGINVLIMGGVKIGPNAFIGPGTPVLRDVERDMLVYARPEIIYKKREK